MFLIFPAPATAFRIRLPVAPARVPPAGRTAAGIRPTLPAPQLWKIGFRPFPARTVSHINARKLLELAFWPSSGNLEVPV